MRVLRGSSSIVAALLVGSACMLPAFQKDHYTAGIAAMRDKQYADARQELAAVPPQHKNYQEAQFLLGRILYLSSDREGALQQMLKARSIDVNAFEHKSQLVASLGRLCEELMRQWSMRSDDLVSGELDQVVPAGDIALVVSHKVLAAIDLKQKKLAWELPIGVRSNAGRAIPVVEGDVVYVVSHRERDDKLVALRRQTGEPIWSHPLSASFEFTNVAVGPAAVYVGDAIQHKPALLALDKQTGRVLWTAAMDHLPGSIVASEDRVCALTSSSHVHCVTGDGQTTVLDYELPNSYSQSELTLGGDVVFLTADEGIYALRAGASPLVWKRALQHQIVSDPLLVAGGTKLVVQTGGELSAFDARTGDPAWAVAIEASVHRVTRSGRRPVAVGNTIVGFGLTKVAGVSTDGQPLWQLELPAALTAAPVALDDGSLLLAIGRSGQGELVAERPRPIFGDPGARSVVRAP